MILFHRDLVPLYSHCIIFSYCSILFHMKHLIVILKAAIQMQIIINSSVMHE